MQVMNIYQLKTNLLFYVTAYCDRKICTVLKPLTEHNVNSGMQSIFYKSINKLLSKHVR